jgi:hypothetical protein
MLIGCAVVGRLWCAQYIAGYKSDRLVMEGPYSTCRNPLYFFSLLGGTGVGLCSKSLIITAVILAAFIVIYPITIRAEEKKLAAKLQEPYDRYKENVPRFIPNFSKFHEPIEYTVNTKAYRREAFDAICFIWIAALFELVNSLIEMRIMPTYFSIY